MGGGVSSWWLLRWLIFVGIGVAVVLMVRVVLMVFNICHVAVAGCVTFVFVLLFILMMRLGCNSLHPLCAYRGGCLGGGSGLFVSVLLAV